MARVYSGETSRPTPKSAPSAEECSICAERVNPGKMAEHRSARAELHVQLLERRLTEKDAAEREPASATLAEIQGRLVELERASKVAAKTEHVTRTMKQRTDELKAEVAETKALIRASTCTKASWRVPNMGSVRRNFPKGQGIQSAEFMLGGMHGFSLWFYPNGHQTAPAGKCSLFIARATTEESVKMQMRFRLTCTDILKHEFDKEYEIGVGGCLAAGEHFGPIARAELTELTFVAELLSSSVVVSPAR